MGAAGCGRAGAGAGAEARGRGGETIGPIQYHAHRRSSAYLQNEGQHLHLEPVPVHHTHLGGVLMPGCERRDASTSRRANDAPG